MLKNYTSCSTVGCAELDKQLILQTQQLSLGLFVNLTGGTNLKFGSAAHPYLQNPAAESLKKVVQSRPGVVLPINSCYRTLAQQFILYNHFKNKRCGVTAAAAPGKSNHNSGLSIDCGDPESWILYLEREGWDWMGSGDRWHFDYRGTGTLDLRNLSVQAFQMLWNANNRDKLVEDGVMGSKTLLCLGLTPEAGFKIGHVPIQQKSSKSAPMAAKPIRASLRRGSKGADVRVLQEMLFVAGHPVKVDGDYGTATEKAVMAFQVIVGIAPDGVVGQATWAALG